MGGGGGSSITSSSESSSSRTIGPVSLGLKKLVILVGFGGDLAGVAPAAAGLDGERDLRRGNVLAPFGGGLPDGVDEAEAAFLGELAAFLGELAPLGDGLTGVDFLRGEDRVGVERTGCDVEASDAREAAASGGG